MTSKAAIPVKTCLMVIFPEMICVPVREDTNRAEKGLVKAIKCRAIYWCHPFQSFPVLPFFGDNNYCVFGNRTGIKGSKAAPAAAMNRKK
jgi:hypothetical protein